MYGYKLKVDGLPIPDWGCETTVTNYNWESLTRKKNRLEISIVKAEYFVKQINNMKYTYENTYAIGCSINGVDKIHSYSRPDIPVSITTIAVQFDKINAVSKDLSINDCTDRSCLIIPAFLDSMSTDELDELNVLIHKYIMHYEQNSECDKTICYSIIYNILSKLDIYARNILSGTNKKTYNHYVKKVNWIIQSRYNTKLAKAQIAKELGISIGYLTSMYKKSTGKTISEQLLATRMHKAEMLLEDPNIPTSKIASMVGYDDENYFREKFKEYFGMSIKEYKNIKHGNTMYHNKPTKD